MSREPTKQTPVDDASAQEAGQRVPLPEAKHSTSEDIAAFVEKARAMSPFAAGSRGRLVFALDATMSRQPTWDMACTLQADMFREAAALGSLDIRLVYYRGFNECRASKWISDSVELARLMAKIDCRGGNTQIGRVLAEARREAAAAGVRAVVFVGDAMEERVDDLHSGALDCHADVPQVVAVDHAEVFQKIRLQCDRITPRHWAIDLLNDDHGAVIRREVEVR